jgi:hypothetical protein
MGAVPISVLKAHTLTSLITSPNAQIAMLHAQAAISHLRYVLAALMGICWMRVHVMLTILVQKDTMRIMRQIVVRNVIILVMNVRVINILVLLV